MYKEEKFTTYDDFVEHVQSGRAVRNLKNLKYFSMEKKLKGERLHLNRYLLLQNNDGHLYVKYCVSKPYDEVVSYANVRGEFIADRNL